MRDINDLLKGADGLNYMERQYLKTNNLGRCPSCNSVLVYRRNSKSDKKFIGCWSYKAGCKYLKKI